MSYQTIDSVEVVQVFSPSLVSDALLVTIRSFPSGSVLIRTVPQTSFDLDQGKGLLSSLSTAVEDAIDGGLASAAVGIQGIDDANQLYDAVVFTVVYSPSSPVPGTITTEVTVPVDVVAADTQFGSFLTGGSLQDRLTAARDKLAAMATG